MSKRTLKRGRLHRYMFKREPLSIETFYKKMKELSAANPETLNYINANIEIDNTGRLKYQGYMHEYGFLEGDSFDSVLQQFKEAITERNKKREH